MSKSNSQQSLPRASQSRASTKLIDKKVPQKRNRRPANNKKSSDVLISAVISTYLLTYLHNVLQRAEYGASKEGRTLQAKNFAQLRKVLCMDARSMEDASAVGLRDEDLEKFNHSKFSQKVA